MYYHCSVIKPAVMLRITVSSDFVFRLSVCLNSSQYFHRLPASMYLPEPLTKHLIYMNACKPNRHRVRVDTLLLPSA